MNKKIKSRLITFGIILAIIIITYFSLSKTIPETDMEIVQCIGEKSTLYIQLGCSACRVQEEMFGDNLQYLNKIDCFYEPERCEGVTATPTWRIKGELQIGVKDINELKELTGC